MGLFSKPKNAAQAPEEAPKAAPAVEENPGASYALDESYVTYAAESKARILGVSWDTIDTVGVVSAACACEMAAGVKRISGAHWGVSATGLAGPDGGTDDLPVGTVFIGVAYEKGAQAYECHFAGDRMQIRLQAVQRALELLAENMEKQSPEKAACGGNNE